MIEGCMTSDMRREKLKGKTEVYRRSDRRQELQSCIYSRISFSQACTWRMISINRSTVSVPVRALICSCPVFKWKRALTALYWQHTSNKEHNNWSELPAGTIILHASNAYSTDEKGKKKEENTKFHKHTKDNMFPYLSCYEVLSTPPLD